MNGDETNVCFECICSAHIINMKRSNEYNLTLFVVKLILKI